MKQYHANTNLCGCLCYCIAKQLLGENSVGSRLKIKGMSFFSVEFIN